MIQLFANSNEQNEESVSGSLVCSTLKPGVGYRLALDVRGRDWEGTPTSGWQAPLFSVWLGYANCDTVQRIIDTLVSSGKINQDSMWYEISTHFIAGSNFDHITLRCDFHGYVSTGTYSALYIDNLSAFTPDTAWNSAQTPIYSGTSAIQQGENITLASPYTDEPAEAHYWYANGQFIGHGLTVQHNPQYPTHYVMTLGTDSCVRSVLTADVDVDITRALEPAMPDAFTPNGDGLNDDFGIVNAALLEGQGYAVLRFSVYNRWSDRVFTATGSGARWDGHGEDAGVYHYFVQYRRKDSSTAVKKGNVTLVR